MSSDNTDTPTSSMEEDLPAEESIAQKLADLTVSYEEEADTSAESSVEQEDVSSDAPTFNMELFDDIEEDDVDTPIMLHSGERDYYLTSLENRVKSRGDDAVRAGHEPGTPENNLALAYRNYSKEAERIGHAIENIENTDKFDSFLTDDTGKVILGGYATPRRQSGKRNVSGIGGSVDFAIAQGRLKRVTLFNSGFFVDITTPSPRQMNKYYTALSDILDEYGQEFGAHFYMYNDLVIRQETRKLIFSLILNSNLKHWTKAGNLSRSIKAVDFKVLLWAVAKMLYSTGYEHRHICKNEACHHATTEKIDITKLYRNNYDILSKEAIQFITSTANKTVDQTDLDNYQNILGFDKTIKYDKYELDLIVPSLSDVIDFGNVYNGEILSQIVDGNITDIYQDIHFGYYRILTPWVKAIRYIDGDSVTETVERDLIAQQMDHLQEQDIKNEVSDQIVKYIGDIEITHLCYPVFECPRCHTKPEGYKGYFTIDPLKSFFIQLVRKLTLV